MAVLSNDFSTILQKVRSNLLEAGVRYKLTTATSDGDATGSTIISTNLAEVDDAWNGMNCTIITGITNLNGLTKSVENFIDSSGTLEFTNNVWPLKVTSGATFSLTEKGIWHAEDLRQYIVTAANWFLRKASDLNVNYTVREDVSGTSGVSNLPANVMKFVEPIVKIGGEVAAIISPDRAAAFDDDAFIDATNGSFMAYFWGRSSSATSIGQLIYKPATNKTLTFNFVPLAVFTTADAWKVPDETWDAIAMVAAGLALQANERPDLGNTWIQQGFSFLPGEKRIPEAA